MNICFFSLVTYWHGIKGGMEIHEKLLSEELVKRGHHLTFISTRHPEGKEFENHDGIDIHYLKNTIFGSQWRKWKQESIRKFLELGEKKKFDLICCTPAIIPKELIPIAEKKKIPVAVILEGHELQIFLSELKQTLNHKKGYIKLLKTSLASLVHYFCWELPLFKKCSLIIAVSDEVARTTQKWYFVDKKKIHTVYNGIETGIFCPDQEKRERIRSTFDISHNEKLLLFFSFVTKQKGLHILINALSEILKSYTQIKLMVVGDGDYLSDAKKTVKQSGLDNHVIFTGHIPRENSSEYINASDIYILPTLRQEGMPFSLLEAMSCQKPVLASNIGGLPSVIDDGINGLLIPPGNTDQLVQKILYLLDNKDFSQRLAENARKKAVEKFSLKRMVDETAELFELAIAQKQ